MSRDRPRPATNQAAQITDIHPVIRGPDRDHTGVWTGAVSPQACFSPAHGRCEAWHDKRAPPNPCQAVAVCSLRAIAPIRQQVQEGVDADATTVEVA